MRWNTFPGYLARRGRRDAAGFTGSARRETAGPGGAARLGVSAAACLGVCLGACSDTPAAPVDARPEAVCWPGGGEPTEGATVEIGTGTLAFESVADGQALTLHRGGQGGFHLEVNARMRGMTPGDPGDPRFGNPASMFRVFTADGTDATGHECAFPLGYRESDGGAFELPSSRLLIVRNDLVTEVANQEVTIQVEVLDPDGRYAIDRRRVIAERIIEDMDAGPDAGAMDAGVADAGARWAP